MLLSRPLLGVRTRQTYQSASNEHSRCNGGAGYCIGLILADLIFHFCVRRAAYYHGGFAILRQSAAVGGQG